MKIKKNEIIEELIYIKSLQKIDGLGSSKIKKLVNRYDTYEKLLSSSYIEIASIEGISENIARRILKSFPSLIKEARLDAQNEIEKINKIKGKVATILSENYPKNFKLIYDPPPIIYMLGNLLESDMASIAIVGTRNPTQYGKIQAEIFARELSQAKLTIISGLARGIDTISHKTALVNNSRTIAITGCGIDIIYPKENKELYHQIVENGAIITEFEPGTTPDAYNFPKRNRLISALSQAVLIIETSIGGGAMHTANYAIDQQKKLYALPGPVNSSKSSGPNYLIKRNYARLVSEPQDILKDLKIFYSEKNIVRKEKQIDKNSLNIFEQKIVEALENESLHIDIIAEKTQLQISDCLAHLLSLEFKGIIKQLPGKFFCIEK
jgi:DNA processing protein